MSYKISAVSSETNDYETKYGQMRSYKVKFEEYGDTAVSLSQKLTSPAPKVGDVLEGSIDNSSDQYGPRFRKEFKPKGQGGGSYSKSSSIDPHAMYVAYAKDVTVALITAMVEPSTEKFKTEFVTALKYIKQGAELLNKPEKDEPKEQPDESKF